MPNEIGPNEIRKEWVPPPEGGVSRLRARLDKQDKNDRREMLVMGTVTGVLSLLLIVVVNFGRIPEEPLSGSLVSLNAQASEVPGTPKGVHFYWIYR